MTRLVIDWSDINTCLQKLREKEKEWNRNHTTISYMTVDNIEYFLRCAFEKYGFWVEENNNG